MAASRKFGKRRRQAGPAGLVLCLAFVLAAVFLVRAIFVVKRVSVTGNETVGDQVIIGISGIKMGESIFSVDEAEVARAFEKEGLVALKKVDVAWPSDVRLTVGERQQAAVVDYLGISVIVDEWGSVMGVRNDLPTEHLPVVTGFMATSYLTGQPIMSSVYGQFDAMVAVLGAIKSQGLGALVSELNVADLDNLYLMMRGGLLVELGDSSDMNAKLIWLQSSLQKMNDLGLNGGKLDVTSGKSAIFKPNVVG